MDVVTFVRTQWDRFGAWLAIALGALALLLGWIGVSGTVYPAEQLPYIISGGLLGVCLIGVGAMLWLSADLRDEWGELHEIAQLLERQEAAAAAEAEAARDRNGTRRRPPVTSRRSS